MLLLSKNLGAAQSIRDILKKNRGNRSGLNTDLYDLFGLSEDSFDVFGSSSFFSAIP